MSKVKIAVVVGATRDTRFALKPSEWIVETARQRGDMEVELLDLKSFDLPFFNEAASNRWMPSKDPKAIAWQKKVGEFDGFIVVTPEYNRSITGALKNAFDQAYLEWNFKPIGFVGYGVVGAARAIEHARTIAIELKMVPVRAAVHIGGSEFSAVSRGGGNKPLAAIEDAIRPAAKEMLDDLALWAKAAKALREEVAVAA